MKKLNRKGFTLVEMLVVIAIIAILVSILVPTVMGATDKAKAATDAANLRSTVATFTIDYLTGDNMTNFTKVESKCTDSVIYAYKNVAVQSKSVAADTFILIKMDDATGTDACFCTETEAKAGTWNADKNIESYAQKAGK